MVKNFSYFIQLLFKNVKQGRETVRYEGPITRLGPVVKLTAETSSNSYSGIPFQVTLKWDALEGADSYIIYREDGYVFRTGTPSGRCHRIPAHRI